MSCSAEHTSVCTITSLDVAFRNLATWQRLYIYIYIYIYIYYAQKGNSSFIVITDSLFKVVGGI